MTIRDLVIVGTGQAGFQVAVSLRQEGFDGNIVMLGEEKGLPYQRPPLSKTYLKEGNPERLLLRNADFFEKNRITIEDGVRATRLDRHSRRIEIHDGRSFAYDHLVLAVGARNRRLPIEGSDAEGILSLRTVAEAEDIRRAFSDASQLVVVGGGFIGLEIGATAAALGKRVTVVEATDRLMSRAVSPPISDFFLSAHRAFNVDARLDAYASRMIKDGAGRVAGVELSDGARIDAELVIVSAGIVPNCELAAEAGLYVHDGIRVNDRLQTEDASISAIGDCASFPFGEEGLHTRLESVQNAIDQGKCVAKRLLGHPEPYWRVPWFWSDQGPYKLQMAGLTAGADQHITHRSDDGAKLSVFCFRQDELIGVETVNVPADHMAARKVLATKSPITVERFKSAGESLAALLTGLAPSG